MNPALSAAEVDTLLEILERGMVHIRLATGAGDSERAEAIADALHNVPRLLKEGQKWGWTVDGFRNLFLAALVGRYPDLAGLERLLDEIR